MRDDVLRPDGDADQVAIPGGELLERLEHALALRAELGPAAAELGLALRQVEPLELLVDPLPRLLRARVHQLEDAAPAATEVEKPGSV